MMKKGLLALLLIIYATISAAPTEEKTVTFSSIKALTGIIAQKTAYYQISDTVTIDGPYYVFTISCDHDANYQVRGITELLKACHEISVIEWFRSTPQGSQVWTGAKDSISGIGKGTKQVILHPGDSGVAIGRKVAKTGRSIGRFLKGVVHKEEKSSTGEDLSAGAGNFFTSDKARVAAYELHLDVYSKNPYVIAVLDEIAKKRAVGSLGVSAAAFVIPGAGAVQGITSGALTPGAFIDDTEKMIRDNPPAELNRELERQFSVTFSQAKHSQLMAQFMKFLANPNYTPRQKAYITLYFEQLGALNNLEDALHTLAAAQTVEDAEILDSQMQMLSAAHNYGSPFASFAVKGSRLAARNANDDTVMILPYDYADDTPLMREEADNFPNGKTSRNLWLVGECTPAFEASAKTRGIESVKTEILHYKAFQNNKRIIPEIRNK